MADRETGKDRAAHRYCDRFAKGAIGAVQDTGDVDPEAARFMANAQVPWNVAAAGGANTQPAWASKPSWYMVTTEDRMIPPVTQRTMSKRAGSTVVEQKGSHAVYVSQPRAFAALIETAVNAVANRNK